MYIYIIYILIDILFIYMYNIFDMYKYNIYIYYNINMVFIQLM